MAIRGVQKKGIEFSLISSKLEVFFNSSPKNFRSAKNASSPFFSIPLFSLSPIILFKNKNATLNIFFFLPLKIKSEIYFSLILKNSYIFRNEFSDRQMAVRNYNDCKNVLMTRCRDKIYSSHISGHIRVRCANRILSNAFASKSEKNQPHRAKNVATSHAKRM